MRLERELTYRFKPMPRRARAEAAAAHKPLVNNNENAIGPMATDRRGWPEGTDFIQEPPDRPLTRRSTSGKDQAEIKRSSSRNKTPGNFLGPIACRSLLIQVAQTQASRNDRPGN
jgi:hypothetical protein